MNINKKLDYEKVFIAMMAFLIALFVFGFISNYIGDQANIFFHKTGDYMADYYNVAKYSINKDVYMYGQVDPLGHEHAYLPLTYIIFYFLGKCADYGSLDAFSAGRGQTIGLATSSFFMFLSSAILYIILYDAYKGGKVYKFLISTILLLSGIFIFSYERGNIINLATALTFFFILNYKNKNRVVKELALIALAVAAALKGYPAVFGIFLLFDKRYKDAIRLAIYGLLLVFLPFLFFKGGFRNIPVWIKNLSANSDAYNYGIFPRFNFRFWASQITNESLKESIYNLLSKVDIILCGLAVITSYFHKQHWKVVSQLLLAIMILPVNSAEYCGLYLFLGIILFFNEENKSNFDWVYLVLFVLILNPYQIMYRGQTEWNITSLMMNLSTSIMLILLTSESTISMVRSIIRINKSKRSIA